MTQRSDALAAIAAAEASLVAAAGHWQATPGAPPWAYAVVASKFLAASSPHSIGIMGLPPAALADAVAGYRAVFAPRDLRVTSATEASALAADVRCASVPARVVRYRDVMAADIVLHVGAAPAGMPSIAPRPGSHIIWCADAPPPFDVAMAQPTTICAALTLAGVSAPGAPWARLTDIVAGRIDGRQLDEVTVTWLR